MLTGFQRQCRDALATLLASRGLAVTLDVRGMNERYVTAELPGSTTVYIYEDGAEVAGPTGSARLEREDFASLDDLQRKFLTEVARKLDQTDQR